MRFKTTVLVLVVTGFFFFSVGCSMFSKNQYGGPFQLKAYEKETLGNGLQILWIEDQSLPRLNMELSIRGGSVYEKSEEAGVQSLVLKVLKQATEKYSSLELPHELDLMGLSLDGGTHYDSLNLSLSGLSSYSDKMVDLFQEVLLRPRFDQKDLEREKKTILSLFKSTQDNPSSVTHLSFIREMFPHHPYGRLTYGPESISQFTTEDCWRVYKLFYRPQRSLLVVNGFLTPSLKERIRQSFSLWDKWESVDLQPLELKPAQKFQVVYHKGDLEQSQISFGHPFVARHHKDFLKLRIANMVLGGSFASRLNQKIRDDLGLTYSIGSSIEGRLQGGYFSIKTFTRHEKVEEVVREVEKVYENFVSQGITESELEGAKSLLIGQFPSSLETTDHLASSLQNLWIYGLPEDYLKQFRQQVESFKLEDINAVTRQYFKPQDLSLLIYTDKKKAEKSLKKLGVSKIKDFKL
jgi:zinc protease